MGYRCGICGKAQKARVKAMKVTLEERRVEGKGGRMRNEIKKEVDVCGKCGETYNDLVEILVKERE